MGHLLKACSRQRSYYFSFTIFLLVLILFSGVSYFFLYSLLLWYSIVAPSRDLSQTKKATRARSHNLMMELELEVEMEGFIHH